MSTWGTGLWDSDIASEIRGDFKKCLIYTSSLEDAISKYFRSNHEMISDTDDGPIAIMVIAQMLWKYGLLSNDFLSLACHAVGRDLENWKNNTCIADYSNRKKQLDKYLSQLKSIQPKEKQIKRLKPFENSWQKGDILAYKYKGSCQFRKEENSKIEVYSGGYLLFIFECMEDYPVFYVKFCQSDIYNLCDFNNYPFIPFLYGQSENREHMVYRVKIQIDGQNQANRFIMIGHCDKFYLPNFDLPNKYDVLPFDFIDEVCVSNYYSMILNYCDVREQIWI